MEKTTIAVFFGAKSFEHDVSILTGIEVCNLLDTSKYNVIPVYLDLQNNMWTGEALLDKRLYPLVEWGKKLVSETQLIVKENKPTLKVMKPGFFGKKPEKVQFDVAFLAFHGEYGENGQFQGLCEMAGIPYTGCRTLSAGLCMNKPLAKQIVKSVGVPVLDDFVIKKPCNCDFFDIENLTKNMPFNYPIIVKPCSMGSSVGVSKASDLEELNAAVLAIFALNDDVLIEPFVENLEEYNLSITKALNGKISTSVIERPFKKNAEFLSFVEKYLSGDGKGTKMGGKLGGGKFGGKMSNDAGSMISMSREYNPESLSKEQSEKIKDWAIKVFETLGCSGAPRIDFMCNSKTQEFYFTEANTIPGSLAYYLWEAAEPAYSYTELVEGFIDEALKLYKNKKGDVILSTANSEVFKCIQ